MGEAKKVRVLLHPGTSCLNEPPFSVCPSVPSRIRGPRVVGRARVSTLKPKHSGRAISDRQP